MNREIKFRALYRHEWYEVQELHKCSDTGEWTVEKFKGHDFSPDSEHVKCIVEFTGLKDKNEVEIYEGDIICFPRTYLDQPEQTPNLIREVKYSVDCFRTDYDVLSELYEDCEVIGNVFENPELLEATK